jgi:hypothetical protein
MRGGDVTYCHDLDIREPKTSTQVSATLPTHSDTGQGEPVVRAKRSGTDYQWGSKRSGRPFPQKISSCYIVVFCHDLASYVRKIWSFKHNLRTLANAACRTEHLKLTCDQRH